MKTIPTKIECLKGAEQTCVIGLNLRSGKLFLLFDLMEGRSARNKLSICFKSLDFRLGLVNGVPREMVNLELLKLSKTPKQAWPGVVWKCLVRLGADWRGKAGGARSGVVGNGGVRHGPVWLGRRGGIVWQGAAAKGHGLENRGKMSRI